MRIGRKGRSADQGNALLAMLDTPRLANNLTIFYSVCLVERQSPELEEYKSIESTGRFPAVVVKLTKCSGFGSRSGRNIILTGTASVAPCDQSWT